MEHYKNAPQKLRDELSPLFAILEETIAQEVESAFTAIIANNPNLTLYSLGLYYHGWGYIIPTFSSEEGLEQVAKHYIEAVEQIDKRYGKGSDQEFDLEKKTLRWSPCDSPHHGEEELESMMPKTEALLSKLSSIMDFADPTFEKYQWPQAYQDDSELYDDFFSELYYQFEEFVISAMNKIWENKHLHDFFVTNDCALTLNAGDISDENFLEYTEKLNSKRITQKLTQEIQDWHEASKELSKIRRDKRQQELTN
ncbi:DUF4303 domain-containing protein [Psychromonas algicola]|uniref:DUF4303 domain-containing protein n=1 Tax=Psychromonas algicola TaxID=2555642 RepID=UPI00141A4EF1|nr:DUF4303 domain-containing protein [Psychromonas sp. RZ5]